MLDSTLIDTRHPDTDWLDAPCVSDSFRQHRAEVSRRSIAGPETQRQWAILAQQGSERARHQLAESNLRLVMDIAKRYDGLGLPLVDLWQEGYTGLMHAITKYDPYRGFKFTTYATYWIRQAIARAVQQQSRIIRMSEQNIQLIRQIDQVSASLKSETGEAPTFDEIAEQLNVSRDRVEKAQQNRDYTLRFERMNDLTPEGDPFEEILQGTEFESDVRAELAWERFLDLMKRICSKRGRHILEMRMRGMYLHEIGEALPEYGFESISKERVRQIEEEELAKLRDRLAETDMREALGI